MITLTTLFCNSLVATLTTLIYMENRFITDYTDYAAIQDNMKNSLITEFIEYTDEQ